MPISNRVAYSPAPGRSRGGRRPAVVVAILAGVIALVVASSLGVSWADGPLASKDSQHREPSGSSQIRGGGLVSTSSQHPTVRNLDPHLLKAIRSAAEAAAEDGTAVRISSGWRSRRHQELLLRRAVKQYGSVKAASRWVATPESSKHVSGDAVDVGPASAWGWMAERGAAYGLCRVYDNEPWHFELFPRAVDEGCPPTVPDASHAPGAAR